MKIPLFDIDGTILQSEGDLSHKTFEHVFEKIYQVKADIEKFDHAGKIDRQIIKEGLLLEGIALEKINELLEMAIMEEANYYIKHLPMTKLILLPGVKELFESLREMKSPIGLLTGNNEPVAWAKLEMLGIRDLVDFGAFGNMADERFHLVEIAIKRAEDLFGKKFKKNDFVIIGDTPRDIECAKLGGISSIGVATGSFSKEELEKAGADMVLNSLEDKEAVIGFLNN